MITSPTVNVTWYSTIRPNFLRSWAIDAGYLPATEENPFTRLLDAVSSHQDNLDHLIEFAGRQCYRSWNTGRSHEDYILNLLEQRHGSVFEHATITFAISGVSRSLSHELVRHRAGFAFSQESQRYVDASDVQFVCPPAYLDDPELRGMFETDTELSRGAYTAWQRILKDREVKGKKNINQAARAILPNAAETRLVTTINLRALRHFFEVRGSLAADPEIRRLAIAMMPVVKRLAPITLDDVMVDGDHITVKYSKI